MRHRDPTFNAAIERARKANILVIAQRLGAKLTRVTHSEWVGSCPRCGGCDRFAINAHKQIFNCRRCGVGGGAIAFTGFVSGSSFTEAVALINDGSSTFTDKRGGQQAACRPVAHDDRSAAALRIWAETHHLRRTLAEAYLASRSIELPFAASLRFHAGLNHPSGSRWPAMVALVTDGESGKPVAIHRTYLARNGKGKAPVEPQKMMLGPTRGGAVRLSEPGETLAIGEGLESCLSAMQATGIPPGPRCRPRGSRHCRCPPKSAT